MRGSGVLRPSVVDRTGRDQWRVVCRRVVDGSGARGLRIRGVKCGLGGGDCVLKEEDGNGTRL